MWAETACSGCFRRRCIFRKASPKYVVHLPNASFPRRAYRCASVTRHRPSNDSEDLQRCRSSGFSNPDIRGVAKKLSEIYYRGATADTSAGASSPRPPASDAGHSAAAAPAATNPQTLLGPDPGGVSGSPDPSPSFLRDLPLWRADSVVLPGQQALLHVHTPHYVHMFDRLFASASGPGQPDRPCVFGHVHLPSGSRNLGSREWALCGPGSRAPTVGVLMEVNRAVRLEDGKLMVLATAMCRIQVLHCWQETPYSRAQVALLHDHELLEAHSALATEAVLDAAATASGTGAAAGSAAAVASVGGVDDVEEEEKAAATAAAAPEATATAAGEAPAWSAGAGSMDAESGAAAAESRAPASASNGACAESGSGGGGAAGTANQLPIASSKAASGLGEAPAPIATSSGSTGGSAPRAPAVWPSHLAASAARPPPPRPPPAQDVLTAMRGAAAAAQAAATAEAWRWNDYEAATARASSWPGRCPVEGADPLDTRRLVTELVDHGVLSIVPFQDGPVVGRWDLAALRQSAAGDAAAAASAVARAWAGRRGAAGPEGNTVTACTTECAADSAAGTGVAGAAAEAGDDDAGGSRAGGREQGAGGTPLTSDTAAARSGPPGMEQQGSEEVLVPPVLASAAGPASEDCDGIRDGLTGHTTYDLLVLEGLLWRELDALATLQARVNRQRLGLPLGLLQLRPSDELSAAQTQAAAPALASVRGARVNSEPLDMAGSQVVEGTAQPRVHPASDGLDVYCNPEYPLQRRVMRLSYAAAGIFIEAQDSAARQTILEHQSVRARLIDILQRARKARSMLAAMAAVKALRPGP